MLNREELQDHLHEVFRHIQAHRPCVVNQKTGETIECTGTSVAIVALLGYVNGLLGGTAQQREPGELITDLYISAAAAEDMFANWEEADADAEESEE